MTASAPSTYGTNTASSLRFWAIYATLCLLLNACALTPAQNEESPPAPRDPAILRYDEIVHPVVANNGMVVSQNTLATYTGRDILAAGGNAIDAAIATGFALAVTLPRAGNIGGSGFMLVHTKDGETVAVDFRSAAPAGYNPDAYRSATGQIDLNALKFGAHATGVPGTVAGLYHAWQRFGSMPWERLLAPAIALARDGIVVSHDLATALASEQAVFDRFPASRKKFRDANNNTPVEGSRWRQPDLARSLQLLADQGADTFYRGALGRQIVDGIKADGGYLTMADLDSYRVRERAPLSTTYRGKQIVAMPPVSGGGLTLLQMLNVLQRFPMADYPQGGADSLHLLAEVMKRGAANRRSGIGDPDFVDVPVDDALSEATADELASTISLAAATPVTAIRPRYDTAIESRDTTHYSVVDREGNAVATTYTLGYSFGSGYVAPGTGILLDNQLRNFTYSAESHANAHAPGKRMMSTMTPTLVFDDAGQLELVTGTPGGGRIINVILQLLVNVIDYDMNIASATHAPRIHQPWRSEALTVEPGFSPDTLKLLELRGHTVIQQPSMGSTQSIGLRDGLLFGAADPRRPGALAAGTMDE